MGIFVNSRSPSNEEEYEALVSILPGYQGPGHHEYAGVEALNNSDIFTAVMMLASDLAKMDIHVKEENVIDRNHKVDRLLNKRPNNIYNAYTLKLVTFANAMLTKHGYIEIERDSKGQPDKLYTVKTSAVQLKKSKQGQLYYEVTINDKTREVRYEDMINYMPYSLDGVNGLSMLGSLAPDLDMQKSSKAFFSNFFRQGTQAGGLLKLKDSKLSKEAREKLRVEFQKANSGANNAGKVLVLDETMDYSKFEIDTEILKLINSSNHSTAQVAKVFGIPLHKFGINTSNMSMKDSMSDYLQTTLSRYMKGIQSEFEFKLLPNTNRTLDFDTESYRRIDWEGYSETISNQYKDGALTLDEYREKIGMPPIGEDYAKTHRVSLNMVNAEMVDEYQASRIDKRLREVEDSE